MLVVGCTDGSPSKSEKVTQAVCQSMDSPEDRTEPEDNFSTMDETCGHCVKVKRH